MPEPLLPWTSSLPGPSIHSIPITLEAWLVPSGRKASPPAGTRGKCSSHSPLTNQVSPSSSFRIDHPSHSKSVLLSPNSAWQDPQRCLPESYLPEEKALSGRGNHSVTLVDGCRRSFITHVKWWHLTAAQSTNHIYRFLILATNLRDNSPFDSLEKAPGEGLAQCHSEMCAQADPRTQIPQKSAQWEYQGCHHDAAQHSDSQLVVPEQLQQQHLGTCQKSKFSAPTPDLLN